MKALLTFTAVMTLGLSVFAQARDAKDSDKLDLKKLEDKYWAAKDADFSVVQNRTYTKAGRPFVTLSYGPMVNDEWSIGRMTNVSGGYYLSERWGFELAHEMGDLKENEGLVQIKKFNGLQPNYNKFVSYTSANFIWVPFYAKMSFLDRKIVYFDMQFALGLGSMTYESQLDPSETSHEKKTTLGYNFDFTQQLFFSEHFAVRLDLKNKWSKQDLQRYRLGGSGAANRDLGTTNRQDTSFLLGLTFFY
ncbi:MAG: outer membrane beta-barrel domain-containing protein [Bdellovibrio sp.]|jgi:outer membrane beta-barrel protein